jgi:hypothetical protein
MNTPYSTLSKLNFDTEDNLAMAHQADLHDLTVHPDEYSNLEPEPQHADVPTNPRSFLSSVLHALLTYVVGMIIFIFVVVQIMELVLFVLAPIQMVFVGWAQFKVRFSSWLLWGAWGGFMVSLAKCFWTAFNRWF